MDTNFNLSAPIRRAYSVKDFCRAYSLSRSTTYKLIKDGRLRSVTVMGRRLIPADAAEELVAQGVQ